MNKLENKFSFRDAIFQELQELESDVRKQPSSEQKTSSLTERHRPPLVPTFDQQMKQLPQQNQQDLQKKPSFTNPVSLRTMEGGQNATSQQNLPSQRSIERTNNNDENVFLGSFSFQKEPMKHQESDMTAQEIHRRAREKLAADLLAHEKRKEKEEEENNFQHKKNRVSTNEFEKNDQEIEGKVYARRVVENQQFKEVLELRKVENFDFKAERDARYEDKRDTRERISGDKRIFERIEEKGFDNTRQREGQLAFEKESLKKWRDDNDKERLNDNLENIKALDTHSYSRQPKDIPQASGRENNRFEERNNLRKTSKFEQNGQDTTDDIDLLQKQYLGKDLEALERELLEKETLNRQLEREEYEWQMRRQAEKEKLDKEIEKNSREEKRLTEREIDYERFNEREEGYGEQKKINTGFQGKSWNEEKEEKVWQQQERDLWEKQKKSWEEQNKVKEVLQKERFRERDDYSEYNDRSREREYENRSIDYVKKIQRDKQERKDFDGKKELMSRQSVTKQQTGEQDDREDDYSKNCAVRDIKERDRDYERENAMKKTNIAFFIPSDQQFKSPLKTTSQFSANAKESYNKFSPISSNLRRLDDTNHIVLMSRPQSEQLAYRDSREDFMKELNKSFLKRVVQENEAYSGNYDNHHFKILLESFDIDTTALSTEIWRLLDLSANLGIGNINSNTVESSLVYSVVSVLLDMQTFNNRSASKVIDGICASEYSKQRSSSKSTSSTFESAKYGKRIQNISDIVEQFRRNFFQSPDLSHLGGLFKDVPDMRGAVSDRSSLLAKDQSPLRSFDNMTTPQKYKNSNAKNDYLDDYENSSAKRISSQVFKKEDRIDINNRTQRLTGSKEGGVHDRLFRDATPKSLKTAEQLRQIEKTLREKEEAELKEECTFKPSINKNSQRIIQRSKSQSKIANSSISPMRQAIKNVDEARQVRQFDAPRTSTLRRNESANKILTSNRKRDEKPMLFVDVSISKGRSGKLSIYAGQEPEQVAEQFAQTYQLSANAKQRLVQKLENLIANFEKNTSHNKN